MSASEWIPVLVTLAVLALVAYDLVRITRRPPSAVESLAARWESAKAEIGDELLSALDPLRDL